MMASTGLYSFYSNCLRKGGYVFAPARFCSLFICLSAGLGKTLQNGRIQDYFFTFFRDREISVPGYVGDNMCIQSGINSLFSIVLLVFVILKVM